MCVSVFLGTKPNADDEIKRYKPKIFNVFEMSTDNMRVCRSIVFYTHSSHQTPPNDKNKLHNQFNNRAKWKCVWVCFCSRLFVHVVHTKFADLCVDGVRFCLCVACVCVYVLCFFCFPPQANTSKIRDCCFPKSFGQHLLDPHTHWSSISHQDGVRIRRKYFWRGNPAVRQIPTKTDGP